MLYWILEKMGFKKARQEQIMKAVCRIMGVVFICAFIYGLVKMVNLTF